ncbi:MAG TPA: PAS domain-containing protein [Chloroflexota bacterium]|jgi:PAS domain-containing protein|nr:PAS domain-containing protein [Chloroflexota bacterium]
MDGEHLTLALVEAQVGSLLEVLPIALLVTSADGEVLRANTAAVDLFGTRRQLVGASIHSLLPFMPESDTLESIRGAIYSTNRIRPVDVRLRHLQHSGEVVRLYVIHG